MIKAIAVAGSLLAGASLAAGVGATPAEAHGFVAVGIGIPLFPPFYAPPPVFYAPPPVVVAPSPVVVVQPPQQFWYYCDNPAGYYPYVPNCPTPWRPVMPQAGGQQ
ncbi:MAG TPA: hypothetical protein VF113_10000 [Stellaceae bacterium]